jgi:hypothetical protein
MRAFHSAAFFAGGNSRRLQRIVRPAIAFSAAGHFLFWIGHNSLGG